MTRLMKGLTRRAAALWPNGRMEAYAALPGVPGLEERERRAHLRRGALAELADEGVLVVDEGRQPGAGDVGRELDRAEPRRPLADRSLRVTEAIRNSRPPLAAVLPVERRSLHGSFCVVGQKFPCTFVHRGVDPDVPGPRSPAHRR